MTTPRPHLVRSRWAAIGAAVAVTLGAGGLATTFAASAPSSLIAITPVRVLDTRLASMGPALASAAPRLLDVTGAIPTVGADGTTIANASVVPDGATAIVANVTIVTPTTAGFVAVRPGTASGAPTTSNLNAGGAGVVVPNSVTVELPTAGATAGQIQLWFQGLDAGATSQLLVDIVGYYQAGTGTPGPAGPAGPSGPVGPAGPAGPSGLTYIGSFGSTDTVAIGNSPPVSPGAYAGVFNLAAGRYYVTGDLTVLNSGATAAIVSCSLYAGSTPVGNLVIDEVGPNTAASGFTNLPVSNTFNLATAGSTSVSFRCYRSASASLSYWFSNMTLFKVS